MGASAILFFSSANDAGLCKSQSSNNQDCSACHSHISDNTGSSGDTTDHSTAVNDIQNVNFNSIEVYPNPTSNYVMANFNLKKSEQLKIDLMSVDGRRFYILCNQQFNSGTIVQQFTLPNNLPAGNYYVCFETKNGIFTKKIIIQ